MNMYCIRNKDELKATLGKYALKEKIEYRIIKSTKTRFLASYKDKIYVFKVCVGSI